MAAYAAVAHLKRASIRLGSGAAGPETAGATSSILSGREAIEDLRSVRTLASEEVRERWAAICEAWSQMTFYLFDAESWR